MKLTKMFQLQAILLALSIIPTSASEANEGETRKSSTQADKNVSLPGGEAGNRALVGPGDLAPDFIVTTTDNKKFSLSGLKGKVVLLDFFATWCPPCREELPHLEKEVWQKFQNKGLQVLLVGREHNSKELKQFKRKQKLTMPVAADPKREIYAKFAEDIIPRTFVIGKNGKVLFESQGFEKTEFAKMIKTIAIALDSNE